MNMIPFLYPFQQNSAQKLRDSADQTDQREVLRTVFVQKTKNTSEKVSFSLPRFFLTSKRNEEKSSKILLGLFNVSVSHISHIFLLLMILITFSCSDILEVPDISTQQITILAPLDGSSVANNTINFNWDGLEDIDNYRVQLAQPSFENATQILLDSLLTKDSLGFIANRIRLPLLNGSYEWRVKGVNSGFETPFTLSAFSVNGDANADIVAPNTPVLVSPSDGATQDETAVQFTWTRDAVAGSAERDSIYVYTDDSLQTLEIKSLGANKAFDTSLTSDTYYWFVKAFDDAGNESDASDTFQFTIN